VIHYVDSTVLLRHLFAEPAPLELPPASELSMTSELTRIECRRTVDRIRLTGQANRRQVAEALSGLVVLESGLDFVDVSHGILTAAAAPMQSVVGTLDAIHLATAVAIRDSLNDVIRFLTHDRQQAAAARALGFQIAGVDLSAGPT
jgi:predicted nucleic acid-binding protein